MSMTQRKRRLGDPIKLGRTVLPDDPYAMGYAMDSDMEVNAKVELRDKLKIADDAGIGGWVRDLLHELDSLQESWECGLRDRNLLQREIESANGEIAALKKAVKDVPEVIQGHGGASMTIETVRSPIRVGDVVMRPNRGPNQVTELMDGLVYFCDGTGQSTAYVNTLEVIGHVGEGGEYPGKGEWQTHTVEADGTVVYGRRSALALSPFPDYAAGEDPPCAIEDEDDYWTLCYADKDHREFIVRNHSRAEAIAWLKEQQGGDGDV